MHTDPTLIANLQNQIQDLNQSKELLNDILDAISAGADKDFLNHIVAKISQWFDTPYVIIGRLIDDNCVKTTPMYIDGEFNYDYTYNLKDAPCNFSNCNAYSAYSHNVQSLFPNDELLAKLNANALVGIKLFNEKGEALGIVCAISKSTLQFSQETEKLFKIIGNRICLEIERIKEHELLKTTERKLIVQNHELENLSSLLRNTNEDLAYSEKHYRLLAENVSDVIWVYNVSKGERSYISPSVFELRGFTVEEAMQQGLDDSFSPESVDKAKHDLAMCLQEFISSGGKSNVFVDEFELICKDGSKVWVEFSGRYSFNENKEIEILGISRKIGKRKEAEQRLKENEIRYRTLFEKSTDPIIILHENGIVHGNEAAIDALCINTIDQFIGKYPWDMSPELQPDGRNSKKKATEMIGIAVKKGFHSFDWVHKNSHNENRWYNVSLVKVALDGQTLIYGILRDIHKRKQQEVELNLLSKKLSKVQEIGKVGHFEWFSEKDMLRGSEQYFEIFEANEETHNCLTSFLSVIHFQDRDKVQQELNSARENNEFFDIEFRIITGRENTKYIHAIGNFEYNKEGIATYLLGIVHDITKQKEAERVIAAREQHLKTIFNASQVGISLNKNRKFVFTNKYFCELLGYKPEEIENQLSSAIYASQEEFELAGKTLFNGLKNKSSVVQETRLKTKGGEIVSVIASSSYYNGKDNSEGIITVLTDITKQKENEKELISLNQEKNKFLSVIAHDLKGPMGAVVGLSQLLNENYGDYNDHEKIKFISHIHSGINKTYLLLENLLTWSLSQLGKITLEVESIGLMDILQESISLLQNAMDSKEISVLIEVDARISVYADKSLLGTVLRNLVSNAIKFSYRGATVSIKAVVLKQEKMVKISIIDTGVGIRKENLGKLFKLDKSSSTPGTEKEGGTGLGLILCKEFVIRNGGHIFVESEVGKGSEFYFTLPLSRK